MTQVLAFMNALPGFDRASKELSSAELDGAELLLGVRLPKAFREIAAIHDGCSGDAEFQIPDGARLSPAGIGLWLSFRPWSRDSVWSWLSLWGEHALPGLVVPFGEDGGGNLVCLDYRKTAKPSVCFWFHELAGEEGLYPVAPSFEAWLESVVPAEDEG